MRLLHYPPQSPTSFQTDPDGRQIGIGAHTEWVYDLSVCEFGIGANMPPATRFGNLPLILAVFAEFGT